MPASKVSVRSVLRVYAKHVRRYRWMAIFLFVTLLITETIQIITPWWYKKFFDVITTTAGQPTDTVYQTLFSILITLGLLKFLRFIVRRGHTFGVANFEPRVMEDLERSSFEYLLGHSYQFFTDHFAGSLARRIHRLSRSFEVITDEAMGNLVPLALGSIGVVVVLSRRSVLLSVIVVIWIFLFLFLNYIVAVWKLKYDIERAEKDSAATAALSDALSNSLTIKLFASEPHEGSLFGRVNEALRKIRVKSWNLSEINESVQSFLVTLMEVGGMMLALNLWRQGILSVGDIVLLQTYLLALFDRLWGFGRVIRRLYEAFADAKEMVELLQLPHGIRDQRGAKPLKVRQGRIEYRNVDFNYHAGRKNLNHFQATIASHEKVALVGSSGAGKSTIIKLLFRFYDLDGGKILIDGQDISRVTQASLRSHLALVPQEPVLFHRTLMENIQYGCLEATPADVIAAAKKAHCHEFIMSLPKGYSTYVGERGIKLSGGERQRVAIARAILKNAPILVLDEATSSLDSESELLIQDALRELMKDKTVIVIAHRLSTIMQMDRILVVQDGRVMDEGTHRELVQRAGTYKTLWDIQAGGFLP